MVATLVDEHLRPLGLLKLADGSEPPLKRSNPLLGLKLKFAVTDPRATRRLTDPFRILFRPVLAAAVVARLPGRHLVGVLPPGPRPAAYDAFQRPHLLLLVFVVTVLSGGFHEFGHAAAARYGGAEPGVIGAGLYLVWPAFYTDVTDSYRLGRGGRIRTDLGGLYFNAVVVVLTFGWWYATRLGRAAAPGGHPDPADGAAADAAAALRRLPPARRPDRRPRPLPPDPADPARPAAAPVVRPGEPGAQAVGPRGDHRVGAGHRSR